jgi:alanyl-tRNA synthetase
VRTERLYYTDSYLANFEARVLETADRGCRVYLDRTAFYPTSGGQPNDLGTLAEQPVLDVIDEGERIAHVLAAPLHDDVVQGQIDWNRRYDHMQQHTGQHVLSAVFLQLFSHPTLSFHLSTDASTIELGAKEVLEAQIHAAEERANQIVREARPVNIRFENADAVQGLRKPGNRTGMLRVIEIEDLDRSACGGTHARSSSELGPIQIRKSEKIRGNVRVEFVCGMRALRRAKQDFRIVAELAKDGGVPIDRLVPHVAGLRQRLHESEKERQRMASELARREGDALHERTQPSADGLRRILLRVPAIDDAVRAKAQAFTAHGRALALIVDEQSAAILIAASSDSGFNAGTALKEALLRAGGRGGGSATLAQGKLPDRESERLVASTLGFPGH